MSTIDTATLDLIDHAVFVLEPDATGCPRYVAFNDFACRILDKPAAEIIGLNARELYGGRLGEIAFKHHCEALHSIYPRVYEILLPMVSEQRMIRTTLRPVCDDTNKVIRLVGSSVNLGARELQKKPNEAGPGQSEMEKFVYMAAHDLRSPLRNVKAIASLCARRSMTGA